jgi:DNA-binding NtrC family response regulator
MDERASILIAERDPVARSSLADLFRSSHYQVVEAGDFDAVISHFKKNSAIEVVLMDIAIPKWRSIVSHAKSNLPSAALIAMGTLNLSAMAPDFQSLGVHEYLLKPLTFENVIQTISRVTKTRSPG